MKSVIILIRHFCYSFYNIIESIIAIILFSKFRISKLGKSDNNQACCYVLGNGPSLKLFLQSYTRNMDDSIYVANFFCLSEMFNEIKPDKYIFVDSSLYTGLSDERVYKMLEVFAQIDWPMTFHYPSHYSNSKFVKRLSDLGNPYFSLKNINVTPVDGPIKFRNLIYKLKLGMPKCYNVLNASLCCAINDGYKTIYIGGADHSWLSQLYFDEQGNLCTRNEHFYQKDGKSMFVMPKGSLETGLLSFSYALKSYRYLNEYAKSLGINVYNLYKQSYIDIFEKI